MTDALPQPDSAPLASQDHAELEAELRAERARFYHSGRWSGPIGLLVATSLYIALIQQTDRTPSLLWLWAVAMTTAIALQIASFTIPALTGVVDADGLPLISKGTHAFFGLGWGATLWLDLSITEQAEFRWLTLASLYAIGGAASAGLAGVNSLGVWLITPMWLVSAGALVASGHPLAAIAVVLGLLLSVANMRDNGSLWIELIRLRANARREALTSSSAARHDPLTRLLNRSGLLGALGEDLQTHPGSATVLFIDLDHFKEVNDRLGHRAGDIVLVEVAARLRAAVRQDDVIARLGGDEFCIALHRERTTAEALALAHRIVELLETPITIDTDEVVNISASVGVAAVDHDTNDLVSVFLDADQAMYLAKRRGRGQVVHFDEELRSAVAERRHLTAELRSAIANRQIAVDAHPTFDLSDGSLRSVDLVPVWPGRHLDDDSAGRCTEMARDLGLAVDLTDALLATAARLQQRWSSMPGLADARITINISPAEIDRGHLLASLIDLASSRQLAVEQLTFELSDAFTGDDDRIDAQFAPLVELGVALSIDAVASRRSSLEQLTRLPIETVKIDRALVTEDDADLRSAALVRGILHVAEAMGQRVVVTGVENADQVDHLRNLGFDGAQGSFFGDPVRSDAADEHFVELVLTA